MYLYHIYCHQQSNALLGNPRSVQNFKTILPGDRKKATRSLASYLMVAFVKAPMIQCFDRIHVFVTSHARALMIDIAQNYAAIRMSGYKISPPLRRTINVQTASLERVLQNLLDFKGLRKLR